MKYEVMYNGKVIAVKDLKFKEVAPYKKALLKGLPKAQMIKVAKPTNTTY